MNLAFITLQDRFAAMDVFNSSCASLLVFQTNESKIQTTFYSKGEF